MTELQIYIFISKYIYISNIFWLQILDMRFFVKIKPALVFLWAGFVKKFIDFLTEVI